MADFIEFPKIARYSREVIVTEKIDGTNAQIVVCPEDEVHARLDGSGSTGYADGFYLFTGSRNRWITPKDDNFGFARWVNENAAELVKLGPGRHYGEWWGSGIQRGYGLQKGEKRFSLFNVSRWADRHTIPPESENTKHVDLETLKWAPSCCHVVPVLARGTLGEIDIPKILYDLQDAGSVASPGFRKPEGIVIFHAQGNVAFKKTYDKDDAGKGHGA